MTAGKARQHGTVAQRQSRCKDVRIGRRFDSGLSHHPACPCREVVFFLSSFPARRMPGIWGGSSVEEQRPAKPWPQVRILSIPPALCVGRRVSLLSAAGRNAAPGPTPPGLVIPGCPYTDPSGHGLPLVRAPSEFAAPRIHHGSVVPAEGPPNFIHPNQSQGTPERRGGWPTGIRLPMPKPCVVHGSGATLPGRLDPANLFEKHMAPRKGGAAAGGIPLPEGTVVRDHGPHKTSERSVFGKFARKPSTASASGKSCRSGRNPATTAALFRYSGAL